MRLSEQAVFRWVVIVGIAAASVIVVTALTRPLVGAIWGLLLLVVGAVYGYAHRRRRP